MLWRPDPLYEAARRLPEWSAFHAACGRANLAFDLPHPAAGGGYSCLAFEMVQRGPGDIRLVDRATGRGATIMDAITAAYQDCGIVVPGADAMLARQLTGREPVDDFEELLG